MNEDKSETTGQRTDDPMLDHIMVCVETTNLYSPLVIRRANSIPSSCTCSGVTGSSGLKLSLMW